MVPSRWEDRPQVWSEVLRCPECGSTLYRVGEHGEVGPYTLAFCSGSECAWRGALYEDGVHALLQELRAKDMDPKNRQRELLKEGEREELRKRVDRLERVAGGWKMLAEYRGRLLDASTDLAEELEDHIQRMDEVASDG